MSKMIVYELDGEKLVDSTPCAGVRADLKMCLLMSDCCKKVRLDAGVQQILIVLFILRTRKPPENVYKAIMSHPNVRCFVIHFLNVKDRWYVYYLRYYLLLFNRMEFVISAGQ